MGPLHFLVVVLYFFGFLQIFLIFLMFWSIWWSNPGSVRETVHFGMVLGIIGATLVFWDWKRYFWAWKIYLGVWKIYLGLGNILWVWGIYFVGLIFCGSDISCSKIAFRDFGNSFSEEWLRVSFSGQA